jgi:heat-inducible transcriptional repressor
MSTDPSPELAHRSYDELDARKAAILQAIVGEYIGTALPVGSSHVASAAGVAVSPATVRSEMVALERDGYLMQPHTSAGRVPTDKGYRFFVDHLATPGQLGPSQRQKVSRFFAQVQGGLEDVLERTSALLSDLTSYAAVVVGPSHEEAAIRSVQVVGLSHRRALVVAVLSDGAVENLQFELPDEIDDETLAKASGHLQRSLAGSNLGALGKVGPSGDRGIDAIGQLAARALSSVAKSGDHEPVFVGGPSRLAGAFDAIETVQGVLTILEEQLVVVSLLRDVLERGLSVAIGSEHGYELLSSCAVVVAPVEVDGRHVGAVGLLGPTRMDYPSAMAAADAVGRQLSDRIDADRGSAQRSKEHGSTDG